MRYLGSVNEAHRSHNSSRAVLTETWHPCPPGGLPGGHGRLRWACGYMSLRKADLDQRFPGLIDSILAADAEPVA